MYKLLINLDGPSNAKPIEKYDNFLALCVQIVTCQNLHFGKYVRLTVCYLPKFSILASMFFWRFVTL